MSIQTIKLIDGKDYVLLPAQVYQALRHEIDRKMAETANAEDEFVPFVIDDYVDNPISLARIRAGVTQQELATKMNVTQAYISKAESQAKVTPKLLQRVNEALTT